MNFPFYIASKVAGKNQKSFSRVIIRFAIVTMALSIAVMIISSALIAGFKKEISSKVFGFWGHIHITDADINSSLLDSKPIEKDQTFYPHIDTIGQISYPQVSMVNGQEHEEIITSKAGISHVQAFAIRPGIIETKAKAMEAIFLKGVDQDFNWEFMKEYLKEGRVLNLQDSLSKEIMLSRQTADRLNVNVGDSFIVHFIENQNEIKRKFEVVGIYKTGLEEYDKRFAIVDIRKIQQLMGWTENQVSGFEVFIEDIDDIDLFTDFLYYEIIPVYLDVEPITKKFREIFEWLNLHDITEMVILIMMIIVAIINMVTALLILILERTNMIGTLKAMGASNWNVRGIFIYYAAYIIGIGLIVGNILGLGVCYLQDYYGFITLSEENYYLSVAPISINYWTVLWLNIGTLVVTLLFLLIPSWLVTRVDPVKAIRFK